MKSNVFIILLFLFSHNVFAQQKDKSELLYDQGNLAFANKDYKTADSLYSLSLLIKAHPDTYFNKAACRKKMGDFEGYCVDLRKATLFGDKEAEKLYSTQCVKLDTVYKNKGESGGKDNYDFVEFIASYKYNSDFDYDKYDSSGICVLSKSRINNVIFYKDCRDVANSMYKGNIDSLLEYIKSKKDLMEEMKNYNQNYYIYLTIQTDEKGNVLSVKSGTEKKETGIVELIDVLANMPSWKPARYNDRPVKYTQIIRFKFYNGACVLEPFITKANNAREAFTVVESMPEFPGGIGELVKFVQKTMIYPKNAKKNKITGKCFLRFVINTDGTISDIQIIKEVPNCNECNEEAVRIVKSMPKWKPGSQNGRPVSVYFNLPINFSLR